MSQIRPEQPENAFELQDRNNGVDMDVFDPPNLEETVMRVSLLADAEAPEGGYGWVIAAAGAAVTWWFVGLSYTWGVMQAALVSKKNYSASTLAFVGSLQVSCIAIFAIGNARIIQRVGARVTAMTGVFLLGLGSLLSGFAVNSIIGLFFTWGFISGVGTSLCFLVSIQFVHRSCLLTA
jgi:MFS family permease